MTRKSPPSTTFPPRAAVLALLGLAAGAPFLLTACDAQSAQAAATQIVAAPEVSVAEVQAAHAAVDAAELDLSFTRVRAPIAGVVSRAEVTAGNFVAAGQTLLTRLVSIDPVYVRFDGDEAAYLQQAQYARENGNAHAGAGQPVWVGLGNEQGYPHQGELVFTDNELDAQTGTIRARARLSNRERIFTPGLFARVRLGEGATRRAILIDDRAVGTDQTRRFVYVVGDDDSVEYRPVELGPLHEGLRVVREGLAPGERIVVNGLMRIRPGITVSPQLVAMRLPAEEEQQRLLAGNRP